MKWLYGKFSDFTAEEYRSAYRTLTESRKQRVDRYKREDDRARSLLGELLLRKLLFEEYGIENAQLETAPNGRPMLKNEKLFVSIAHCEEMAACAVSEKSVGIDIERVIPRALSLALRICTKEEEVYLFGHLPESSDYLRTDPEALERFYEIWTAKEAYFKYKGTGITDLRSVNILTLDRQLHRIDDYLVQIVLDDRH